MIQVGGPDPGVLCRRMRHHAEAYRPLIDALLESLLLESALARDDQVHQLYQSRTGPGSFGLYTASGESYHFRPNGQPPAIDVFDHYVTARRKLVRTLRTPEEARNFMRGLGRRKLAAAA